MISITRLDRTSRAISAAALILAPAAPLVAQDLPLKRPALTPILVACPVFPTPPAPVSQVVDEANRLATLGQEASIEGDHKAARDLFLQATQLDARDASLAYRLGREYEEMHQRDDAAAQYCRYLSLAPNAGDVTQIADRVAKLLSPAALARGTEVVRQFRAGLTAYDARDWGGAALAFTKVIGAAPQISAAVYDRGLSRDHQGDNANAIHDLSRYLQLEPQAPDAAAVRARIQSLRRGIPSAGTAFALGLLPGGGQFYTGQPVLGVAVVAAAAGGAVLAAHSRSVTKDTLFTAPFGGTYIGTITHTQHPNVALGIAVAGGATILGAIEAAVVAHGRGSGVASDTLAAPRSAMLPHAGPVTFELPTVLSSSAGLRVGLPMRITF
jgi:tetratricopeptide (TPR) repeat protein